MYTSIEKKKQQQRNGAYVNLRTLKSGQKPGNQQVESQWTLQQ